MSLLDLKFIEEDGSIRNDPAIVGHRIADLDDEPGSSTPPVSAAQLKAAFDYIALYVLGPRFNALIDALRSKTDGDSGADNVFITPVEGVTGATTVQEAIEVLKGQLDGVSQGAIPDGSLTDAKLSTAATDILSRFAAHLQDFMSHVKYLGTTAGTSTAYTITQDGFAFDTSKVNVLLVRFHTDCGNNPTLNINNTGAKILKPNLAASLSSGQLKQNGMYLLVWYPTTPATMYVLNPDFVSLTLEISDITGLQTALDGKAAAAHSHAISAITGLQSALDGKAAASHSHTMSNITDLATALAGKQATITGAASSIVSSDLTADRVLVSTAGGKVGVSNISTTLLGYLSGLTSSIQEQLNGKLNSSGNRTLYVAAADPGGNDGDIWVKV